MQPKRSHSLYLLLGTIFLTLPLFLFSCHHYYAKNVTKETVEQFSTSSDDLFAKKLDSDPTLKQMRYDHFLQQLDSYASDFPLLPEAYAQVDYRFRFIDNHSPTNKHELLQKRVKGLYDDGIDLDQFSLEEHQKHLQRLKQIQEKISSISKIVLTEEEKENLVNDVVGQMGKNDDPLNELQILEFCLKPENEGKYTKISNAWNETMKLANERSTLESKIEAESGKSYFELLLSLLIDQNKFVNNWKIFDKDPKKAIEEMEPKGPHYKELKEGLKKYRLFAKKPYDDYNFSAKYHTKIKQGSKAATGDLVVRIKKRLALEGYWNGALDPIWDDDFTQSLVYFQENHQVVPDGVYGYGTANSFNVTMKERINQIRLSLERLRQSLSRWDSYHVRINIPQMLLEVRENNKIIKAHKIIVGNRNAKNHTPAFIDEIEMINFNPSWYVPKRILKEEMQPAYEKDEEYFKKKGYHAKVNEEGKILAVTQPPGRGNALGVVKILFPNKHDVYLHDTPTKYLFKRTVRPFSHGCMRLQNAVELAKFLLEKDGNPALDQVDDMLSKRATKEVFLKKKVPIHIEYVLVTSNEKGELIFVGDVYSREKDALLTMNTKAE